MYDEWIFELNEKKEKKTFIWCTYLTNLYFFLAAYKKLIMKCKKNVIVNNVDKNWNKYK